jgi:peroxiredoxin
MLMGYCDRLIRIAPARRVAPTAFCLIVGIAAVCRALAPGDAVPELSLPGLDGKQVSLSALRGKVVLVDFWASWCAPCKDEMPFLEAMYRRLKSRGLVVLGVSVDQERENAEAFIAKMKVSFPIVHDGKHAVADRFKPPRMPTSYVLDREGKVRHVHEGFRKSDARKIEQQIEALLQ